MLEMHSEGSMGWVARPTVPLEKASLLLVARGKISVWSLAMSRGAQISYGPVGWGWGKRKKSEEEEVQFRKLKRLAQKQNSTAKRTKDPHVE